MKEAKQFLINIISDLVPFKWDLYTESIFYMNSDGKYIFEQDNKNNWFYVRDTLVWSVLKNKYSLDYDEAKKLIKDTVEEAFKNKDTCVLISFLDNKILIDEAFRNKSVTIYWANDIYSGYVEKAFLKQKQH